MKLISQITGNDFEMEVLELGRPVVVEFFLPWCPSYQRMRPKLTELAEEFEGRAKFVQVDIEEEPTLSNMYGVTNSPTYLIFHEGSLIFCCIGIDGTFSRLREQLDEITL